MSNMAGGQNLEEERSNAVAKKQLMEMFGSRWTDTLSSAILDCTDGDVEVAAERILLSEAEDASKLPTDVIRDVRASMHEKRKKGARKEVGRASDLNETGWTIERLSAPRSMLSSGTSNNSAEEDLPSPISQPTESTSLISDSYSLQEVLYPTVPKEEIAHGHPTERPLRSTSAGVPFHRQQEWDGLMPERTQNPSMADFKRNNTESDLRGGGMNDLEIALHMRDRCDDSNSEDSFDCGRELCQQPPTPQLSSFQRHATWDPSLENFVNNGRTLKEQGLDADIQRMHSNTVNVPTMHANHGLKGNPVDLSQPSSLSPQSKIQQSQRDNLNEQLGMMRQDEKDRLLYSLILQRQESGQPISHPEPSHRSSLPPQVTSGDFPAAAAPLYRSASVPLQQKYNATYRMEDQKANRDALLALRAQDVQDQPGVKHQRAQIRAHQMRDTLSMEEDKATQKAFLASEPKDARAQIDAQQKRRTLETEEDKEIQDVLRASLEEETLLDAEQKRELDIAMKLSQMDYLKQRNEFAYSRPNSSTASSVQKQTEAKDDDPEMEKAIELSKTEFARQASAPTILHCPSDAAFKKAIELSMSERKKTLSMGRTQKVDDKTEYMNSKKIPSVNREEDEDLKRAIEASLSGSQASASHSFSSEKEQAFSSKGGTSVSVRGAGIENINGMYKQSGTCDGVSMFKKEGIWENNIVTFCLFRCFLSDNERMWFISVVPENAKPGSEDDIDLYCAPIVMSSSTASDYIPPQTGWNSVSSFATQPGPMCLLNEANKKDTDSMNRIVHVERAGLDAVNGEYKQTGQWDGVGLYKKTAYWNGANVTFALFRSDGCRWFISIVPIGRSPGSNADTDLYTAEDAGTNHPPCVKWKCIPGFGKEPSPICSS